MKPAVRQTRTHIGELLARHGLNPRHDLGQNFLVDLNLLEYLVAQAEIGPDDVVFEVGSGTGGLTTYLAQQAGKVISVELDPRMRQLASEALAGFDNVVLLGCDVLKNKNRFADAVRQAFDEALAGTDRPFKLVANLPYGVATPVISNLVASRYPWTRMVVTIQRELAERMNARERTSDYGALSAWMQAQCRVEILKRLPPDVFWPRPKVESAIVRIDPVPELRAAIVDREFLHDFLRDIFQHRRKLLRGVLSDFLQRGFAARGEAPSDRRGVSRATARALADRVFAAQGLGEHARAEELAPAALVALSHAVFVAIHSSPGPAGPTAIE